MKKVLALFACAFMLTVSAYAISAGTLSAYGQNEHIPYKTAIAPKQNAVIAEGEYGPDVVTVKTSDSKAVFFSEASAKAYAPTAINVYTAYDSEKIYFGIALTESVHSGNTYKIKTKFGFAGGFTSTEANSGVINEFVLYDDPNDISKRKISLGEYGVLKFDVDGKEAKASRRWEKDDYPCAYSGKRTSTKTTFEFALDLQDVISGKEKWNGFIPNNGFLSFDYTVYNGTDEVGTMTYGVYIDGTQADTEFTDIYGACENSVGHVVIFSDSEVCGDADGDGMVNTRDSALVARKVAKWSGGYDLISMNADTDRDGKINLRDSAILARYLASWSEYSSLPYSKKIDTGLPPVAPLPDITLGTNGGKTYATHLSVDMEKSIAEFEKDPIVKDGILFYGHSHYTRWRKIQTDYCAELLADMIKTPFGKKVCINHGFGSSTFYDLCYFYERTVRPYEPRAIVITAFLNDSAWGIDQSEELLCFEWLLKQISTDFPDCQIYFTDYPVTPEVSSTEATRRITINEQMKEAISEYKNAHMIEENKYKGFYTEGAVGFFSDDDVGKAKLGTTSTVFKPYLNVRSDIFLPKKNGTVNVHHTPTGYEMLAGMYKEALADVLMSYDYPDVAKKVKGGAARLEDEIVNFEKKDPSLDQDCIMFIGSSGFTRWTAKNAGKDLADEIVGNSGQKIAVNHGFGSSTMYETLYYYERAVAPWNPRAIVVTSYINDYRFGYTNDEIMQICKAFVERAKFDNPGVQIYFTDVRPRNTGNSDTQVKKYLDFNSKMKAYAESTDGVFIIETSKWTFWYLDNDASNPYKNIDSSIYISDNTHYTKEGYAYFAAAMKDAIKDVINTYDDPDYVAPLPNIPSKLSHDISFYQKNATSFAKKTKIKDPIVFTGASIIYRWREKPDSDSMTVAGPEKALINAIRAKDGKQICINNGFGGSTMYEVAYYYKQMIRVFNPKVLVVSGIGNDKTDGYTPSEVMQYIAWIARQATVDRPDIQIYFTDFKPTMNNFGQTVREWIAELNGMLEEYETLHSNFHIIKISEWPFFYNDPADVGTYQNINPAVFCGDKVHLSELGYDYYNEYFKKVLEPYL